MRIPIYHNSRNELNLLISFYLWKNVIVDESSVNRENSHQSYQVSSGKENLPDLRINLFRLQLPLSQTHPDSKRENDESVPGIAKHDGKEEGEGDDGENSWIGLTIAGNSVSINQLLESRCKLVGPEKWNKNVLGAILQAVFCKFHQNNPVMTAQSVAR